MNKASTLRATQPLSGLPRICIRQKSSKNKTSYAMPEGHGEKIWVWAHRRTEQTIYTLRDRLNDHHDLKQIPFNGKTLKPASLRKDYWYPMAWINFASGDGEVGRSVFQKLRELKHLHEVSWPETLRRKTPDQYTDRDKKAIEAAKAEGRKHYPMRSKRQRGVALNAQKKNSIADMAAVLSGVGPGNKILLKPKDGPEVLADVTVRWSNDLDRNYARKWSENVAHEFIHGENIFKVTNDGAVMLVPTAPAAEETVETPGTTASMASKGPARGERELSQ